MAKPKNLEQLRAEKEQVETQLAQEQHMFSEGDTSVTFAIADTGSFEDQFDAMLEKMVNPDAELIAAFRRLVW